MLRLVVFLACCIRIPVCAAMVPLAEIEVCDLTFSLKGNESRDFFYGFAEGDQIVFSFEEQSGLPVSSVAVRIYPDNLRFEASQVARIQDKIIRVERASVVQFHFSNDRKDKSCRVTIRRIPATSKTQNFPTTVRWEERYDTIYLKDKPAKMELQTVTRPVRTLYKTDTLVINLLDKKERVASRGNLTQEATSVIKVQLPANTSEPDRTTQLVSWAYWIGVGQEAEGQFTEANRLAKLAKSATGAAKTLGVLAGPYGALASLAIDGVSFFLPTGSGDNILYEIRIHDKVIDQGNGPSAYARHQNNTQGELRFLLSNDNLIESVDVNLRIMAVVVQKSFRNELIQEQLEVPVLEKELILKKVPVLGVH